MSERKQPPTKPTATQIRRAYITTPADASNALVDRIRAAQDPSYRLIRFGVRDLDNALTLYPGSVSVIAGRPGMGKSMLCKCVARLEHQRIVDSGADNECVVYVTLEEPDEKLNLQIARAGFTWRDVVRNTLGDPVAAELEAIKMTKKNRRLFVIQQAGMINGRRMPPLGTDQIFESVEGITEEYGLKPTLIVLDYLQLIQGDKPMSRATKTDMVMAASAGAVRIARALKVPVVMAVQAARSKESRSTPLPRLSDMQWASSIEQDADIVLGVWRPAATPETQETIDRGERAYVRIGDREVSVTDSLMVVSPLKARDDGGVGKRYAFHVNPQTLETYEMDWTHE